MNQKLKKLQRCANRRFRAINKRLQEDPLWRGRFQIGRQVARDYQVYNDGWVTCCWTVELIDKKTGMTKRIPVDEMDVRTFDYHIWGQINHFIVHDVDVWREDPPPREIRTK